MQVSKPRGQDATKKPWRKKKHLARRQLFRTYCRFIIHKQRVSGHSMLSQSVLKHLRHSGSVMKSVKKRRIWQNVLRTLFYHKCFVSQHFTGFFTHKELQVCLNIWWQKPWRHFCVFLSSKFCCLQVVHRGSLQAIWFVFYWFFFFRCSYV